MSRLLALDWGEKRIGVAFSEGFLASPHSVINRVGKKKDYARIVELIKKTQAEILIIGLPTTFDPQHPLGPQAKKILKHSRTLAEMIDIPIKMVDETYSTRDASDFLRQSGKKGKIPIDAAAAAVILQAYLDREQQAEG